MAEEYAKEGYILAFQDVRGRFQSQGRFQHVHPLLKAPLQTGQVDETTDTFDTIEWLVKNVSGNNGRVGLKGLSYPGFYAAVGAVRAHPALKAVSPQAPIMDWFMGDDVHRNGAFCLDMFEFVAGSFGPETNYATTSASEGSGIATWRTTGGKPSLVFYDVAFKKVEKPAPGSWERHVDPKVFLADGLTLNGFQVHPFSGAVCH